ncbi:MAG TPA: glycosyltransferase [Flavobacteriales bacterium]|nr:glycosyltransferase [Flavobacteriales bacterium]
MMNKIAVLIPCYNEELTISRVVNDFQESLPEATIYVYDNASTDNTSKVATKAGALVFQEPNKGKGNVVRRMFADIEANIYVIVDGDDTYEASKCPEMIEQVVNNNLDMVVATRKTTNSGGEYRWGHVFGNWMLTRSVSLIFGHGFTDMLSGYRVMSYRFVKSFPITSKGFEIETEMTVHALQVGASYQEIETMYDSRPEGSESKLNTFKDGFRILWMILLLFKGEKPFQFFGLLSLLFFVVSITLSIPLFTTYIETGLVPKIPTAVLSTGLMILSFFSLISGVILDSMSRLKLEGKRANYLSYKSLNR